MRGYAGQCVWIIGAGDGIGRALSAELARRGAALILSGRDEGKLTALASELGGGPHTVRAFDVSDAQATRKAAESLPGTPDRVILLAGQYQPMALDALDLQAAKAMIDVNLGGALTVVTAVLPLLLRCGRGQLALCGSLSAYCGLPRAQPYGATKAAIMNLTQSLRAEVGHRGIDVRLISPGFVRTRLTEKNKFHMPVLLQPEQAARRIADGLNGRAFEIAFPRRLSWPLRLLARLPSTLYFRLVTP